MRYFIFIVCFVYLFSASSIDTKKELDKTSKKIALMNKKLDTLAKKIITKQKEIKKLQQKEYKLKLEIQKLEKELKNSKTILNELNDLVKGLGQKKETIEEEIIKFLSKNYYLNTKEIESLNDLIFSEINEQVLNVYAFKIGELINKYKTIEKDITLTNKKIKNILNKKKLLAKKKKELSQLKKKKIRELTKLKKEKEKYKKELIAMINRQKKLRKKLEDLKILKKRVKVKQVGSSYYKPKVASYKGVKTIPPVKGTIIKKFGSYVDPIYNIRIYNDSITIKTKPNALVRAIKNGKVVYIGDGGDKKVVFIKHKNNLFSIYANLSKVSPLLKKGSLVKKGQVIGRVKDALEFEVTYKDKPINPLKVIKFR